MGRFQYWQPAQNPAQISDAIPQKWLIAQLMYIDFGNRFTCLKMKTLRGKPQFIFNLIKVYEYILQKVKFFPSIFLYNVKIQNVLLQN